MAKLTVSKLADVAGVSADTIRFYEREGLLHRARRAPNGYRIFDNEAVERIRFVKGAQAIGLRLRDIGELLEVRDRGLCPCGHAEAVATRRIAEIDEEITSLRSMREQLTNLLTQLPSSGSSATWPCQVTFSRAAKERG